MTQVLEVGRGSTFFFKRLGGFLAQCERPYRFDYGNAFITLCPIFKHLHAVSGRGEEEEEGEGEKGEKERKQDRNYGMGGGHVFKWQLDVIGYIIGCVGTIFFSL